MQILVTIGSGVSEEAGVEFPTFPLTCVVVLKTLWHYLASVWWPACWPVNHQTFSRWMLLTSQLSVRFAVSWQSQELLKPTDDVVVVVVQCEWSRGLWRGLNVAHITNYSMIYWTPRRRHSEILFAWTCRHLRSCCRMWSLRWVKIVKKSSYVSRSLPENGSAFLHHCYTQHLGFIAVTYLMIKKRQNQCKNLLSVRATYKSCL